MEKEKMNIIQGARVGSKHRPVQTNASAFDVNFFEGCITSLFLPWLIEKIPDGTWQTLQENLKIIILKIISNGRGNK